MEGGRERGGGTVYNNPIKLTNVGELVTFRRPYSQSNGEMFIHYKE